MHALGHTRFARISDGLSVTTLCFFRASTFATSNTRLIAVISLATLVWRADAQPVTKEVKGRAEVLVVGNMSPDAAELKAVEQARVDAIEVAFGRWVGEENVTYVASQMKDGKETFKDSFLSIGDQRLRGEWIKDLSEPHITNSVQGNSFVVTAEVHGIVRQIERTRTSFRVTVSTCPSEVGCGTTSFNDGQDFYLAFTSPQSGFLSIYLDVPAEGMTYRLLPYRYDEESSYRMVKADRTYMLFDPERRVSGELGPVEGMTMNLTKPGVAESVRLIVLFSSEGGWGKPLLVDREGYPPSLESDDFYHWLFAVRSSWDNIEVFEQPLFIQ